MSSPNGPTRRSCSGGCWTRSWPRAVTERSTKKRSRLSVFKPNCNSQVESKNFANGKRFGHAEGNEQTVIARVSRAGRRWCCGTRASASSFGCSGPSRECVDCQANVDRCLLQLQGAKFRRDMGVLPRPRGVSIRGYGGSCVDWIVQPQRHGRSLCFRAGVAGRCPPGA